MPKKFLEGSKQTKPMRNRMADFAKSIESKLKPGAPWLYYSLRFVYRFFYPFASRAVFWSAYLYLSAEYLVLLVLNIGEIKNAEFICPRWFWNFGHQALEPHMLAMRFKGKKLLILLSDYGGYNPYIIDSMKSVVRIKTLKHSRLAAFLRRSFFDDRERGRLLKRKQKLAKSVNRISGGSAVITERFAEAPDQTVFWMKERMELIKNNQDMIVKPDTSAREKFKEIFERAFPEESKKWLVSLYLRKNRDDFRGTEPMAYRGAIERIIANGGAVLCGGDYDPHETFGNIKGLLGYSDFSCERELCDFFFLTQCKFLICTLSGPFTIAETFNVPVLVTNSALFSSFGRRENQHFLYKKFKRKGTGQILGASELFSPPIADFTDANEFINAGLEPIDNDSDEILKAVEEMIVRYVELREIREDKELIEKFKKLQPENTGAKLSPAKPVMNYLENIEW